MAASFTEWGMRAYLRWKTWRFGELCGTDTDGNKYYRDRRTVGQRFEKRWVVFDGGESEASRVPPEWHAWLHNQIKEVPSADNPLRRPWQVEHEQNLTGTLAAYRPPGHTLAGGRRDQATGDYAPWMPS